MCYKVSKSCQKSVKKWQKRGGPKVVKSVKNSKSPKSAKNDKIRGGSKMPKTGKNLKAKVSYFGGVEKWSKND